jgi:hypothetical protein
MFETFVSTVMEVKDLHGKRVMWTSIPEDLKHIFNCTDLKTVDSWKQTMHGDVQLDISMFKAGDKVKMLVQSIGVSGKHCHNPLMRGVPDPDVQKETLVASPHAAPGATPREVPESSPAPVTLPVPTDEERYRRQSAKPPAPAARFSRFSDARKSTTPGPPMPRQFSNSRLPGRKSCSPTPPVTLGPKFMAPVVPKRVLNYAAAVSESKTNL